MKLTSIPLSFALFFAGLICRSDVLRAQSPDEYFKGKTITIYVSNPPGGGYDLNARLVARHMGQHIPGHPNIVVSNMPGARGITGANFIFNTAPRDGTALGALAQYAAQDQILGMPGTQYVASRLGWIGSVAPNNEIVYVWHTVPVQTIDDLKTRETIFAAGGDAPTIARLLAAVAGVRMKLVRGYPGTQEAHLALQRGEVEGSFGSLPVMRAYWPDWLKTNKIKILLYNALKRSPDLPDVPATAELAKTPADRDLVGFFVSNTQIGRSLVAPPDLPADIIGILRDAFDATVRDEKFLDEARQSKINVDLVAGSDLEKIVSGMSVLESGERERARHIAEIEP